MAHRVSARLRGGREAGRGTATTWSRLTLRLQHEYEFTARDAALSRKLAVIAETAAVLTDIIQDQPARCEFVVLIAVELVIAGYQILL